MDYLPIYLKSRERKVVVCGATNAAARKSKLLLRSQCDIHVYSPVSGPEMQELIDDGKVTYVPRDISSEDFTDALVAIIATGDSDNNRTCQTLAKQAGVMVNVINNPESCDFIIPAAVERSPVMISVSTSGATPV